MLADSIRICEANVEADYGLGLVERTGHLRGPGELLTELCNLLHRASVRWIN